MGFSPRDSNWKTLNFCCLYVKTTHYNWSRVNVWLGMLEALHELLILCKQQINLLLHKRVIFITFIIAMEIH
jgi:hypothetical protein